MFFLVLVLEYSNPISFTHTLVSINAIESAWKKKKNLVLNSDQLLNLFTQGSIPNITRIK